MARTDKRILIILPISLDLVNDRDRNRLFEDSEAKYASYVGNLFEEKFSDKESCIEYLSRYDSSKAIFEKIRKPEILPNEFRTLASPRCFLDGSPRYWKVTDLDSETLGSSFRDIYQHSVCPSTGTQVLLSETWRRAHL